MTSSPTTRRAAPARRVASDVGPRAKRGDPEDTRTRLIAAAAEQFELHGYFGTDTNRIARAAGYAPGTFYKHFTDKAEVFLAVYQQWIASQWDGVARIAAEGKTQRDKAERLAERIIAHHCAWPGLRATLRALVALEPAVRKAHRASRRQQLARMAELGLDDAHANAIVLLQIERIADAIADGELRELGVDDDEARARLVMLLEQRMRGR